MEENLKDLYESYYQELINCPFDDKNRQHYICGKQQALEDLAENCNINLVHKNIVTLVRDYANSED